MQQKGYLMRSKPIEIVVKQGEEIPFDGEVVDGFAMVDEAAISGVSAPAMIEAVMGRNMVYKGGVIKEGWLKIRGCPKSLPAAA
jgi:high-affinity K+ transport system ATPase subunit B